MLNVFVKQLDLVALLADFNAEQIAHREHAYPAFAIDNGQMSSANQLHSFEGLMGSFVALNHRAQLAGHVSDFDRERIALRRQQCDSGRRARKTRRADLPPSSTTQTAPMFRAAINSAASCTVAEPWSSKAHGCESRL